MMSSTYPTSIRNIPLETWEMVQALSAKSGADVNEALRQCVVTGSLMELIKAGPDDEAGNYGKFSSIYLARLARRVLGTPIDFLLETGQHPYLATLTADINVPTSMPDEGKSDVSTSTFLLDQDMVEELQMLGMGSFSAGWQPD